MLISSSQTRQAKKQLEEIKNGEKLLNDFLCSEAKKLSEKDATQIMKESRKISSNVYQFSLLLKNNEENMKQFQTAITKQSQSSGTKNKGLFNQLIYPNRNNLLDAKSQIKAFLLAKEDEYITDAEDTERNITDTDRKARRMKNSDIAEKLKSNRLSNVLKVFMALVAWNCILNKEDEEEFKRQEENRIREELKKEYALGKLNFLQAKAKFKNNEDIASYFVLVECYEKHLSSKQKTDFLNADTIDDMLKLLDEKQLEHLKSLIKVFINDKSVNHSNGRLNYYGGDEVSEWFKANIFENLQSDMKKSYDTCRTSGLNLIKKIDVIKNKAINKQKYIKNLTDKYKSRLKKFDGDSIEYRQWIILFSIDNTIPGIDKIYDVAKLLKSLNLKQLKQLNDKVNEQEYLKRVIHDTKYIEPYFYWRITSEMEPRDLNIQDLIIGEITGEDGLSEFIEKSKSKPFSECYAFNDAKNRLIERIKNEIEEKNKLVNTKISKLITSTTFIQDMEEIARSTGNIDEMFFKTAIAEYSKHGAHGNEFNDFLRKAVFLKKFLANEISTSQMLTFRNRIAKVYEYFRNHLTDKEYTVYRGEKIDGLYTILETAQPELVTKGKTIDDLIEEINEKKPVVFDEGLTSTSLNKGVSSKNFHGKEQGNVFFTIKIPSGSKALILDYEEIENVPQEEEILLAPKTKIKINSIKYVNNNHYEIDAVVVS